MAITPSAITSRDGVNAFRTLLEHHGHLVQGLSGSADHGEDFLVIFTKNGERTGDSIYVQVKSGGSYRRRDDYFIPTGGHAEFWKNSNAPVYGVVYDSDKASLFWTNITDHIKSCATIPTRVQVYPRFVLSSETIERFVDSAIDYIATTGHLHKALSDFLTIAPGTLSNSDYLAFFENDHGERMVFQRKVGTDSAVLYHEDNLMKSPLTIHEKDLRVEDKDDPYLEPTYLSGDWILDREEFVWLVACMEASRRRTGRMKL